MPPSLPDFDDRVNHDGQARGISPRVSTERQDADAIYGVGFSEGERRVAKTSENVAQSIVHDIMARGLHTGDRLPLEAAMLQEYRVSRASLREALRLLEVQGLISLKPGPGGGPVVGSVDARHLARTISLYFHLGGMKYGDIFATQESLEPMCAELAARHPDRKERMKPFTDTRSAPKEGAGYHATTYDFHNVIYDMTDNPVLSLITKAVTSIISTHIVSTMDPVELHEAIIEEHADIARAIAAGQASKAAKLVATHFAVQHEYYRRHWPTRFDELIEWR
ncbi:MAG TPA: FCD domain-containing protein [Acidimicrobiales bacterium]